MTAVQHVETRELRPDRRSVEDLVAYISELVLERQTMRSTGVSRDVLEQNRALLVAAHLDLSHALIERYCPAADAA